MAHPKLLLLSLCAGLLAACGSSDSPEATEDTADAAEERLTLHGELYYLERVALLPDSVLVAELVGQDQEQSVVLASTSENLGSSQVPVPFRLEVSVAELEDMGSLVFRGGIVSEPGPLRVTERIEVVASSEDVDLGPLSLRTVPDVAFGTAYRCGDRAVAFGPLGATEYLALAGEVAALRPESAASGARYVAIDGSETEFWSRGDEAMVTWRGAVLDDCERLTAPELPFTARGQEPGWDLRIEEDGLTIRINYGAEELTFAPVEPEVSASGARYEAHHDDYRLTVLIDRQACNDSMADISFPYRVRYTLDGDAHMGCGGDPREVLGGGEWLIEQIGDEAVVTGTVPTIEFLRIEGEDRFAGRASCNRYMGSFQLSGEGVNLSPAASTLMACPDEAQALQERRLLALLGEIYGFGVDQQGRLILRTGTSSIIARR